MNEEQIEALREWVLSEIQYDRESYAIGSDGYFNSAQNEREYAKKRFEELRELLKKI